MTTPRNGFRCGHTFRYRRHGGFGSTRQRIGACSVGTNKRSEPNCTRHLTEGLAPTVLVAFDDKDLVRLRDIGIAGML
jgi:hypothetical protein